MNIIEAIKDDNVFRPFLEQAANAGGSLKSWNRWQVAMRALYGLPIRKEFGQELVKECTGRDASKLPSDGFDSALFLCGRRSGKSITSALIGAYEAVLSGKEVGLAPGELGMVAIISPTRFQSRIVRNYLRAIFHSTPMLEAEVIEEKRDRFTLRNGIEISILTGSPAHTRGFSLIAAIIDEIAYFGLSEESKVRSDTELIRAVRPALANLHGRLICIGSPYARRGYAWTEYQRCFGNDNGSTLVWNAPSTVMNPKLPQKLVDDELARDYASAKAEWLAEFRDDVAIFLPREVIETCVVPGRIELLPRPSHRHFAFVDISGGRGDDAGLAIAHKNGRVTVVDCIKRYKPPFNPNTVIASMAEVMHKYSVRKCHGDRYGAEFTTRAFRANGIRYENSSKNKSELYLELLPLLCAGEVELPDDELLISQLSNLERRTRSGGKDIVDHQPSCHDDLANAVAGVCVESAIRRIRVGGINLDSGSADQEVKRNRLAYSKLLT